MHVPVRSPQGYLNCAWKFAKKKKKRKKLNHRLQISISIIDVHLHDNTIRTIWAQWDVWYSNSTIYAKHLTCLNYKCFKQTAKHSVVGVMIWVCFTTLDLVALLSLFNHELLWIPKSWRVKCVTICLETKAYPKLSHAHRLNKLGHATEKWAQAHKQIYDRMAEKKMIRDW